MRSFSLSGFVVVTAIALMMPLVQAQTYPVKPICIISPCTAGSLGDLVPRAIGAGLTEALGQQILVENCPGASQAIGMQAVTKSPADGYTLVYGSVTSLAINPSVNKHRPIT
jgi:tripartite-type tricarboxylate transporter receptor subunit TctC